MEDHYYTLSIPTAVYRKLNKKQSINKYFKTEYVGNCMELITDFYKTTSDYTHKAWEDYYKEIVGFTQLELVYEKIKELSEQKDIYLKRYVWHRVIGQTWNGFRNEIGIIEELQAEFKNVKIYKTSFEKDHEYCIDAEMYSNNTLLLGIQIKPISYKLMNSPYQLKAKENHKAKNEKYKSKYAPYIYVYHKNHKIYKKSDIVNQINTIFHLNTY